MIAALAFGAVLFAAGAGAFARREVVRRRGGCGCGCGGSCGCGGAS